jgi:tetratricopeptide (TPR) repeat protein
MDSEQVLDAADNAYKQGDIGAAERLLLEAWPSMADAPPDARHLLGRMRFQQKRYEEGEALLRSAIRSEPNSLRHHIALGHWLSDTFNPEGAFEAYAEALRIDRSWPGLLQRYAHVAYRAGRYPEAEAAAREVLAEHPTDVDAWDTLSGALREQNKAKEALEAADKALQHAPGHMSARHSRGAALAAMGKHREALETYEAMVREGIRTPRLWLSRAAVLEKSGKRSDADKVIDEAARLWPQHPRVKKALAERGR